MQILGFGWLAGHPGRAKLEKTGFLTKKEKQSEPVELL